MSLLSTIRGLRRVRLHRDVLDLQGLIKSALLARARRVEDHRLSSHASSGAGGAACATPIRRTLARNVHVVFKNLALLAPLGVRDLHPTFPIDVL